jgi:hypothetical protein
MGAILSRVPTLSNSTAWGSELTTKSAPMFRTASPASVMSCSERDQSPTMIRAAGTCRRRRRIMNRALLNLFVETSRLGTTCALHPLCARSCTRIVAHASSKGLTYAASCWRSIREISCHPS